MLAIIQNLIVLQVEKYKMLDLFRRPFPSGAKDIGQWFKVLEFTSNVALITNFGVLCFTLPTFHALEFQWEFFFACLMVIFSLKWLVQSKFNTVSQKY